MVIAATLAGGFGLRRVRANRAARAAAGAGALRGAATTAEMDLATEGTAA